MSQKLKSFIKESLPPSLLRFFRMPRLALARYRKRSLTTEEIFDDIYKNKVWGSGDREYYSGGGSDSVNIQPYCQMVKEIIQKYGLSRIVDLGCGDFSVGREILSHNVKYIGIDIVEDLVNYNQKKFGSETIKFTKLNVITEDLPDADLCTVRQVLQHLSNSQITTILEKLKKYPYVLITEHYPAQKVNSRFNIDKPHGDDTRVVDNSAVYLDKAPFNINANHMECVLEIELNENYISYPGEYLRTYLIINDILDMV